MRSTLARSAWSSFFRCSFGSSQFAGRRGGGAILFIALVVCCAATARAFPPFGASGGGGPSTTNSYNLAGTGWVIDDGSFPFAFGFQEIAYDPTAGPWHKRLLGPTGAEFAASDTGCQRSWSSASASTS